MVKKVTTPRVLILLAAYNGSEYICEQIDSIIIQKGVDVSILISLDASTDDTLNIIKQYEKRYDCIGFLPYGESLGSAGKNFFHLINKANVEGFDFVAFADQDDIWLENKILSAINAIKKTNSDGYSSNVLAFWSDDTKKLVKKSHKQVKFDYLFESPGPGCSFVITKKLFSALKEQIDNNYKNCDLPWLHDWYCYSFARFNNYKWFIDDNPYMLYRQHSDNEVGANSGVNAFLNRLKTMVSGDGIKEVLSQANFIGQNNLPPIKYLNEGRLGALKLALISFSLRRKVSHKLYCLLYFLLLSIIGFKVKGYIK